ncbi:MAG: dihydrolipoyl dehydrogenase [Candidatus Aerophobetes bacterium]|nr:dihydrolipoyl dehydrogenase [Candidatus Aerophobetes bacterium]
MFDLLVIGGGPAGYHSAIRASQLGGKVCLVEREERLGGVCLNRGCIPTKALVKGTEVLHSIKRAKDFGIEVDDFKLDFSSLIKRKESVVKALTRGLSSLFKSYKIELVKGFGKILSPQKVEVEGRVIEAKNILIATGSRPLSFSPFILDGERVITTKEALSLNEVPQSMVIVGGGVNGCEFAHIFSSLGCKVSIVEMMENILPGEDPEIATYLARLLHKEEIALYLGRKVKEVRLREDDVWCRLSDDEEITGEKLILCVGRKPNIEDIGLDRIGIKTEKGRIWTNEKMQTNIPSIYAAGDVVDSVMLAHVAFKEGLVAAENALGENSLIDYTVIPSCIFTHPEVASVGLTEKEARERYNNKVRIGRFPLAASGKALCEGEGAGFIKIVAGSKDEEVLGVHIIGSHASELISEVTLAISLRATLKDISKVIHPHPTLSEALMEAASDGRGEAIHLPRKRKG